MNIMGRIGLAAGGVVAGAATWYVLNEHGARNTERTTADIAQRSDAAQAEWDDFQGRVEAEFPNMELNSREDHQRFEQFLQQHPTPSWVDVQHEGFTRIHLSTSGFLPSGLRHPIGEEIAYPVGFGGFMALGGAAGAVAGVVRPASSTLGVVGATLGAGALASLGVGSIISGLQTSHFDKTAFQHADALVQDVNSHR